MDPLKEKGEDPERRSESRKIVDDYYSVEFNLSRELPVHQFRVRDMSPLGLGILVNESSEVLKRLTVGDALEMKFNPINGSDAECLKTEIRHITRMDNGRFRGHYLVGIQILERSEG